MLNTNLAPRGSQGGFERTGYRNLLREAVYRFRFSVNPVDKVRDTTTKMITGDSSLITVDVIIPIYKGLDEIKRCLESLYISQCQTPFRIIAINDCGPEPAVLPYLREQAERGLIELYENQENLGFVGTVNRGMALHPDRDVLLLNSDTEVASDWLDRIRACAYSGPRIGTVTPFSNNATICSYPRFCEDNNIPEGQTYQSLDALFAKVGRGLCFDVPTGVGFCMYIRRDCLNEVGLFDVETFGKGYGEENDFCMRAMSRGWRNVQNADVFVYHAGSVSFGASQQPRVAAAMKLLEKKHPTYLKLVSKYLLKDPARAVRLAVDHERLRVATRPRVLMVNLNLGGGTEKHVFELAKYLEDQVDVFELRPDQSGAGVDLQWLRSGEGFRINFSLTTHFDELLQMLRSLGIARLHYHHTFGLEDKIWQLPKLLNLPYDFTAHDYFSFCPRIDLTSTYAHYCGEPAVSDCQLCIERKPLPPVPVLDIRAWRAKYERFLKGAERVIAPSLDTAQKLAAHFPGLRPLAVAHIEADAKPLDLPVTVPRLAPGEPLRVAILGALDQKKGRKVLLETAQLVQQSGANIKFDLVGFLGAGPRVGGVNKVLTVHGPYAGERALEEKLAQVQPHLIWFPAVWPETFSYTLSTVLKLGLPVLAPDLGAFPERLAGRAFSWVQPWRQNASAWLVALQKIATEMQQSVAQPGAAVATRALAGETWYQNVYLGGLLQNTLSTLPAVSLSVAQLQPFAYSPQAPLALSKKIINALIYLALRTSVLRRLRDAIPLELRHRVVRRLGYQKYLAAKK